MSKRPIRPWRARAAGLLVALYALCVMAPAIALGFGDDVARAHCLSVVTERVSAHDHAHAGGTAHSHADHAHDHGAPSKGVDTTGKSHMGSCCGLFCLAALPSEFASAVEQTVHGSEVVSLREDSLAGRGPDRINRPPISLLSF